MPFVKLDTGILDSTLWLDRNARECFLTALLMATPEEFTQPIPQYDVKTMQRTGFDVPPGWYGFVPAAGVAIIRRAGITDQTLGLDALDRLGQPEAESRSPEFDGRRMVRINGGYLILNFMKYRDRDYTGAERAKRYRDRQKEKSSHRDVAESHRDTPVTSRMQSAESESEAKTEPEKNPRNSQKTARSSPRSKTVPEDWKLNEELRSWSLAELPDLDIEAELSKFRDFEFRDPKTDWGRTWKRWVRTCKENGRYSRRTKINGAAITWPDGSPVRF